MNYSIKYRQKGIRPLFVTDDYILVAKKNAIYRCTLDLDDFKLIAIFPNKSIPQYLGSHFRIFERIFRSSPTKIQQIDKDLFIVFRRSQIWLLDVIQRKATLEFTIPGARKALDCSYINLPGFTPMHVFGEYFDNPTRSPVSIWGRTTNDQKWSRIYTFNSNEVEHIHAIIPDSKRNTVWVLTGDFEHSAGIWIAKAGFTDVQPVLRGHQTYRAAWLLDLNGRLVYATDTPIEKNAVFELSYINNSWASTRLSEVDASSIYHGKSEDAHYFSTTLEPGQPTGRGLKNLMDKKPGAGIISKYAKIYSINDNGSINTIFSAKKDWLPYRLGQFGSFSFPSGTMPKGTIIAYGMAIKKLDDVCIILSDKAT
jgi:hypothetical protein